MRLMVNLWGAGYNILKSTGFNLTGEPTYKVGDHFFTIHMARGDYRWSYIFFYKTKQEVEEGLLELINSINNVLSSIPKINI